MFLSLLCTSFNGCYVLAKEIWLVRHPSYAVASSLYEQTSEPDLRMHVSRTGLKQAGLLFEHLLEKFRGYTPDTRISILTSPYRRARSLAGGIHAVLRGSRLTLSPSVRELSSLGEVKFGDTPAKYKELMENQKTSSIKVYDDYVQTHPSAIVPHLEQKRTEMLQTLDALKTDDSDVMLLITHRLSIATLLWHLANVSQGGKARRINKSNFKELFREIAPKLAHTSITRLKIDEKGKLTLLGAYDLPHLTDEKLITGVPKR